MKDQLITFETAMAAKDKGFDEFEVRNAYTSTGSPYRRSVITRNRSFYENWGENGSDKGFLAPTQALLQRWLRETHELSITLNRQDKFKVEEADSYYYFIHQIGNRICSLPKGYKTYENAFGFALIEALKLIP